MAPQGFIPPHRRNKVASALLPVSKPLSATIIPNEATISFDRVPSHGFTMELDEGGLCQDALFVRCHFKDIKFINCVLFDVRFSDCTFQNVTFTNCVLMHTEFSNCAMDGNTFTDKKYEDARLVDFNYDCEDHYKGYSMPAEIKSKSWLLEKMDQTRTRRTAHLKTPAEVRELCKDQVKSNPELFKPTKFATFKFE